MQAIWLYEVVNFKSKKQEIVILGIDAFNLSRGGGLNHLVELLNVAEPSLNGFEKVIIWGGADTLSLIEERSWLEKKHEPMLDRGLPFRIFWHYFVEQRRAIESKCDIIFLPGGSAFSGFRPVVTMSRNILPFELRELFRYRWSFMTLRLILLRWIFLHSLRKAEGVIFLTKYASEVLNNNFLIREKCFKIIPHGLNERFFHKPRYYSKTTNIVKPSLHLIYVSNIDVYKHQWNLVEAVNKLRCLGYNLTLDLIGAFYPPAMSRLKSSMKQFDPLQKWLKYWGEVSFDQLHNHYKIADIGIFASSCENLPNILLETMAAGLPIACSNRGPMPEILGDTGLYFNPEDPSDIANSLRKIIDQTELSSKLAFKSYSKAKEYSWEVCASETFSYLSQVALSYKT